MCIVACANPSLSSSMGLTCCARSEEPGSAERAERILLNMENLYAEGLSDAVANSRCYSAAITAWARSNSPIAVAVATWKMEFDSTFPKRYADVA